jgi:hypothetical protein
MQRLGFPISKKVISASRVYLEYQGWYFGMDLVWEKDDAGFMHPMTLSM